MLFELANPIYFYGDLKDFSPANEFSEHRLFIEKYKYLRL